MYLKKLSELDSKIGELQKIEIYKGKYIRKLFVKYTSESKLVDGFILSMVWKLSSYEGVLVVVLDERYFVVLTVDNKDNLIKKIIGRNGWIYELKRTNIEEQIRLIENKNNMILIDRYVYNFYRKIKDMGYVDDIQYKNFKDFQR